MSGRRKMKRKHESVSGDAEDEAERGDWQDGDYEQDTEEDEHLDEKESESSTSTCTNISMPFVKQKQRKKQRAVKLSLEKQAMVADFFRPREYLYTKSNFDYRDTRKREEAFIEIAEKVQLTLDQFKQWYSTMRTTLSKITRQPPLGASPRHLTDREKNTLGMFGFLQQHIVRVHGKARPNVGIKSMPNTSVMESPPGMTQIRNFPERKEITVTPVVTSEPIPLPQDHQQAITSSLQMMAAAIDPNQAIKTTWGAWLAATVPQIHDRFWKEFQDESYRMVMNYVGESDKLRSQDQQY